MTHSQLEVLLKADGRELLRRLLQDHLDYRGLGCVVGPVIGADGVLRPHARPGGRNLATIVGRVRVTRMGYGNRGVDTLYPMDAALNLPASLYSHGLAREFAIEASKTSYGAAVETVERFTGVVVGMRQARELVHGAAQDFEPFYRSRSALSEATVKDAGPIGVISVDQKGVVMLVWDLRELTKKAAQCRTHKKRKRISKGEKRNAKRMGTVAAVYTIQRHRRVPKDIVRSLNRVEDAREKRKRPKPENKRLWASLEKEMEEVIEDAFQEVQRRDPRLKKEWVGLVDGNKTQIRLLEKHAKRLGIRLVIILDIIHVIEYLWKASCVFQDSESQEAEDWVTRRLFLVLQGKASDVAAGMRRSATRRRIKKSKRVPVDRCAKYLIKYAPYLRYDEYLRKGYPIATGVIEGGCRYLMKDRMDITGARWGLLGAEAVLRLRSIRTSGDFDDYWALHEARELDRNHTSRYLGGIVPRVLPPTETPHAARRANSHAVK